MPKFYSIGNVHVDNVRLLFLELNATSKIHAKAALKPEDFLPKQTENRKILWNRVGLVRKNATSQPDNVKKTSLTWKEVHFERL